MSSNAMVYETQAIHGALAKIDIASILARPEWGDVISFKEYQSQFSAVAQLSSRVVKLDLGVMPKSNLANLSARAKELLDCIDKVSTINHSSPQMNDEVASRKEEFEQAYRNWSDALLHWLPLMEGGPTSEHGFQDELEALRKKVEDQLSADREEVESIVATIRLQEKYIDGVVESINAAAGTVAASVHSKDFVTVAGNFENSAKRWICVAGFLGIITLVTALLLYFSIGNKGADNVYMAIQVSVMRVFIVGFLLTATVWAGQQYRAAKHHQTLNKSKAVAIDTFASFVHAADGDEAIKNAVLLETTRSIFDLGSTGYISVKEETISRHELLLEYLKSAANKAG